MRVQVRTITVPIDENTHSSYQVTSVLSTSSGETLFGYNGSLHTIDLMPLSDGGNVRHIGLETEGDNGVPRPVGGMYVHRPDSIWLCSANGLYLVDTLGRVNKKVALSMPQNGFIKVETNFSMATNGIYYHPQRKSVFYLTATPTHTGAEYQVYEYDLTSDSYQTYAIKGSERERYAGKNFGWKQFPNVTVHDNLLVYNFPINSNVYVLDIESGKTYSYGGQSCFTPNRVAELKMPYDLATADRHMLENVHFYEMRYDRARKLYYRLHVGSASYDAQKGLPELYSKKHLYLTVFDHEFRVLNELDLGADIYNYFNFWTVAQSGLLIGKKVQMPDEKEMIFDLFSLEK